MKAPAVAMVEQAQATDCRTVSAGAVLKGEPASRTTTSALIPADVLAAAKARLDIPTLWKLLGLAGEPRRSCKCPFHEDRSPSFAIYGGHRRWKCFSGCGQGDAIAFLQRAGNGNPRETLREFVRLAGLDPGRPAASAWLGPTVRKPATAPTRPAAAGWPAMTRGTATDRGRLARLRKVSREAVGAAVDRGLIAFGEWRRQPVWFVRDRSQRVAQARRLDGEFWQTRESPACFKAQTLPGGCASWPVGLLESEGFDLIALCEGGPDLLAAFHFAWHEGREQEVAPVAMLGASARIHTDALPRFRGRRVRIFPHCDPAGHKAAREWTHQLREAGAVVDAFDLSNLRRTDGSPLKDLNDLTQLDPDAFQPDCNLLNLFTHEPPTL